MHLLRKEILSAGQQVAYYSQTWKVIIRGSVCEWEEKNWKRGEQDEGKRSGKHFFLLLHLWRAVIKVWWLCNTGVGYFPGNAFAHCTALCLLRRNSEGICFLLFHEPHAFTLTEVDTHQLAMSITTAGWENSWLYLDPSDPTLSLAEKLCLHTASEMQPAGRSARLAWRSWMPSGSNMNDLLKVPLLHILTLAALSLAETLLKGLIGGAFSLLFFCRLLKKVLQRGRCLW